MSTKIVICKKCRRKIKHKAFGLCEACYKRQKRGRGEIKECNIGECISCRKFKNISGKNLCRSCDRRKRYLDNKKHELRLSKERYQIKKKEILKRHKLWRKNNPNYVKLYRQVYNKNKFIKENEIRKKLGISLIGEKNVHEQKVIKLVIDLFSTEKILIRNRTILNGLEMDVYIPRIKLAFEYDGEQHFKQIKFEKGHLSNLEEQQKRDKEKERRCLEKGIKLIRISHKDKYKLNKTYLINKIKS